MTKERYQSVKEENVCLLHADIAGRSSVLRARPTMVCLSTDLRCNLRCPMCIRRLYEHDEHGKQLVIEEKYLIKFAEQVFPTAKILQLNIAGEPLMSAQLGLELELAEEYGLKLDVVTNGTLLGADKERLNKILWNSAFISVSLDSPVRRTYESIRVGADFQQVMDNMRLVQECRRLMPGDRRPLFNINMVLMKRNLGEVQQMIRLAKDLGADCVRITDLLVHDDSMKAESLAGNKREVLHVLSEAVKLARRLKVSVSTPPSCGLGYVGGREGDTYGASWTAVSAVHPDWCFFLWTRVYIDGNANIAPCCAPLHAVAGSIKTDDFDDIWNNEAYQAMRRTFLGGPSHEICSACASTPSGYFYSTSIPAGVR